MDRRVSFVNLQKFTLNPWEDVCEHVDVRARAEHTIERARHDDAAHLGVLEAQALDGVRELDVHPQVVAVQLEAVPRPERLVLLHRHHEAGEIAVHGEAPVPVAVGVRGEVDGRCLGVGGGFHARQYTA